ncbi:MAG: phosphotransferase [Anaerolineae bacterium]|nr:phosphotransferase [Anaerolineae bacterium]
MIHYATSADAAAVISSWDGLPSSLCHLGDSASAVFSFETRADARRILRLTDATYRSRDDSHSELEFLAHLESHRVPAAAGVRTAHGAWTVEIETAHGLFYASVLEYAHGVVVRDDSPHRTPEFFRAWGRNIALIHRASETYDPPPDVPRRWQWDEEILFRMADELIPADDVVTQVEVRELFEMLSTVPRAPRTFGVIHADHGPQNFHYDPSTRLITAFDFGNACYHWFICDLAVALSTVRLRPDREQIRAELLAGYTEIRSLPADFDSFVGVLARLRSVYVYLARHFKFGKNPTPEERLILDQCRARVHARSNW